MQYVLHLERSEYFKTVGDNFSNLLSVDMKFCTVVEN